MPISDKDDEETHEHQDDFISLISLFQNKGRRLKWQQHCAMRLQLVMHDC
jgi:hypothetical protein